MTTTPAAATVMHRPMTGRRRLLPALRPFRTPVRGHAYAAAPPDSSAPQPGTRARLAREPANPADPLAVAVWVAGGKDRAWRIGYLDRGVAARVAPRIDDGLVVDARLDGWVAEPDGRWRRPVVLLLPQEESQDGPQRLWGRPPATIRRPVRA
jgi:hypothetical protein